MYRTSAIKLYCEVKKVVMSPQKTISLRHALDKKNLFIKLQEISIKKYKSNLMSNILMLVNLEPILGFLFEIKSIQNYLEGHSVSAMFFEMVHLWNILAKS